MNSITSVKEQVADIISELHTGKPNTPTKPGKTPSSKPAISGVSRHEDLGVEIVDFLNDKQGPSVKVVPQKVVEKANVSSSDIELLRKLMPKVSQDFEKFVDTTKKPI